MVIHDFYISGFAGRPLETDAPLVIDADAILPCAVAFHFFEPVTRHCLYILQVFCTVEI